MSLHALLQMSDLHILPQGKVISGRVDTAACLRHALVQIARLDLKPDALLLTGDLVDDGSLESYKHLKQLLECVQIPIHLLPGNHDSRDSLGQVFGAYAPGRGRRMEEGYIQYVTEVEGLRTICLDSAVPGQERGALDPVRLEWLDRVLSEAPAKTTLVAVHHPPAVSGIGFMDEIRLLEGAAELEAIISRHAQVQLVVCGHLHRLCFRRFAKHSALVIAPSVAHQIALQLQPGGEPAFTLEPPGCLLHVWSDTMPLTTHFLPLADFAGPFPFS